MIRGTNAEFKFDLPCLFVELSVARITFWQDGNNGPSSDRPLPITKGLQWCKMGEKPNELRVVLNQEETMRFTEKRKAKVQLRAITNKDEPVTSLIQLITVYPIYDETILDGDIDMPAPDANGWIVLDGQTIR